VRFSKTKKDLLHDWLWAMLERSNQEEKRCRSLGHAKEAAHFQRQMRMISNILGTMTAMQHPITR
jgi:hypothetical protein